MLGRQQSTGSSTSAAGLAVGLQAPEAILDRRAEGGGELVGGGLGAVDDQARLALVEHVDGAQVRLGGDTTADDAVREAAQLRIIGDDLLVERDATVAATSRDLIARRGLRQPEGGASLSVPTVDSVGLLTRPRPIWTGEVWTNRSGESSTIEEHDMPRVPTHPLDDAPEQARPTSRLCRSAWASC